MRSVGRSIPAPLLSMLDGRDLAGRVGDTFLLVTARPHEWPHVAMLSAGEVLAASGELRLALWPGSETTANLKRDGRALLMAIVPPVTYHLRLSCRPAGEVRSLGRPLAAFVAEVNEALEDVVAYAQVETGIRFRLVDGEQTLAAWKEAVAGLERLGDG